MKKYKKFIADVLLNIMSSFLPIAICQFLIYPYAAKLLGGEQYGLMITINSVWSVAALTLGASLNSVRMLTAGQYNHISQKGDFALLNLRNTLIGAGFCAAAMCYYYSTVNALKILFGVIIGVFVIQKHYLEVGFRIKLDYKSIALNGFIQALGYAAGFAVFYLTNTWESIFFVGYGACFVFCILKSGVFFERLNKTSLFSQTRAKANALSVSGAISTVTTYADKLLLYPLMGGAAVSVYYTATIFGKVINMAMSPLNSVVLSYISKWDGSKKGILNKVLSVGVVLMAVGYVMTLVVGGPVLGFLFPQWKSEVLRCLPVTTVTVMLNAMISTVSPFTLRFCDTKWQIIIHSVGAAAYFAFALLLWQKYQLLGFCFGTALGAAAKLIIMLAVYYKAETSNKA